MKVRNWMLGSSSTTASIPDHVPTLRTDGGGVLSGKAAMSRQGALRRRREHQPASSDAERPAAKAVLSPVGFQERGGSGFVTGCIALCVHVCEEEDAGH